MATIFIKLNFPFFWIPNHMAIFIPVILATALEVALLGIGYAQFKKITGQFSKPGNASLTRSSKL